MNSPLIPFAFYCIIRIQLVGVGVECRELSIITFLQDKCAHILATVKRSRA